MIRRHEQGLIECTPGVCGGRPRIAGHRIRVQDVAIWHESLGMTPDEIVGEHPGLGLADVYAALAYYHEHLDEIRANIVADEAYVTRLRLESSTKMAGRT